MGLLLKTAAPGVQLARGAVAAAVRASGVTAANRTWAPGPPLRAATTRRRPGTAGFWRSHLSLSKRLRATAAPAGAGGEPGAAANGLTEPPLAPAPHGTLHSAVAIDVAATSDAVSVTAEGGLPWLLHPMPVATWRDERGRPDSHISGDTTPPITTRCSPPSIW